MARKLDSRDDQEPLAYDKKNSPRTETQNSTTSFLDRRSYLKFGATVISALSTSTTAGALSTAAIRDGIEFDRVRHAVDDLGVDPTGRETIDEAIQGVSDGDLIQFPDGKYRFESNRADRSVVDETRGYEGIGEAIVFTASADPREFLFDWSGMSGAYVEGIDFDQRLGADFLGIRLTGDRVVVRNLEILGRCNNLEGGGPLLAHATLDPDGTSLIENVVSTGTTGGRPALGRPGIFIEGSHRGTVNVHRCDLREFPNAAVHADRHSGRVHISDSYFENNVSSVQLSGDGSSITGSEIRLDELPVTLPAGITGGPHRFHGVGLGTAAVDRSQRGTSSPLRIEDTDFRIGDVPVSYPAVMVSSAGSPLEVVDNEITYNNDAQTVIHCRSPGDRPFSSVRPLRVRNTKITGHGSVDAAVLAQDADNTAIEGSTIRLSSGAGDGVAISECENCTVEGTEISVPDRAVVISEGSVEGNSIFQKNDDSPDYSTSGSNRLVISGTGTTTNYEITVDGRLEEVGHESEVGPSGTNAEGVVRDETVSYTVDGRVTDLRHSGGGKFLMNGTKVDPNTFGSGYPHRLTVDGEEITTSYGFTAEGLSPENPTGEVVGEVTERAESYSFWGAIESLSVRGSATLSFASAHY